MYVPACFFAGEDPKFLWCACGTLLEGAATGTLG